MQIFRKYGDFMNENLVLNEKEQAQATQEQTQTPIGTDLQGEPQTSEEKVTENVVESPCDATPSPHEIRQDPEATDEEQAEPPMFLHKIGGTTYKVAVHFDQTSKHTFKDKMERLLTHQLAETLG